MAKKAQKWDPQLVESRLVEFAVANERRGEGPWWAPRKPGEGRRFGEFKLRKKDETKEFRCFTDGCAGKARHATSSYPGALLRWFWQPNSFYCWPCVWKRGAIATCMMAALILAAGLVLMLLPTVGIGWTLLAIPIGAIALYKLLDWGLKKSS